jgi:hypothetical protein
MYHFAHMYTCRLVRSQYEMLPFPRRTQRQGSWDIKMAIENYKLLWFFWMKQKPGKVWFFQLWIEGKKLEFPMEAWNIKHEKLLKVIKPVPHSKQSKILIYNLHFINRGYIFTWVKRGIMELVCLNWLVHAHIYWMLIQHTYIHYKILVINLYLQCRAHKDLL